MPTPYDRGDLVRLDGDITDADGTASDPTALYLTVRDPEGTETGYGWNLSLQGVWDASTNIPALADGTGTAGHYYTVSAAGTVNFGTESITFTTSDVVYYNGYVWKKGPNHNTTAITRDGVGSFYHNIHASHEGTWFYGYEGLGTPTGKSAGEDDFDVRDSYFSRGVA